MNKQYMDIHMDIQIQKHPMMTKIIKKRVNMEKTFK